jgi:hypothetical protein
MFALCYVCAHAHMHVNSSYVGKDSLSHFLSLTLVTPFLDFGNDEPEPPV